MIDAAIERSLRTALQYWKKCGINGLPVMVPGGLMKQLMPTRLDNAMFRKSVVCPPSTVLLGYAHSDLERVDRSLVRRHLRMCDFCSAELQLLGRYQEQPEKFVVPDIPAELQLLAKQWLRSNHPGSIGPL